MQEGGAVASNRRSLSTPMENESHASCEIFAFGLQLQPTRRKGSGFASSHSLRALG